MIDDSGNHQGRFLTAKEATTGLVFKFVVAKSYTSIDSSLSYPVKTDLLESAVLDRVQ